MYEDPQNIIVRSVTRPDSSVSSSGGVDCQVAAAKVSKKMNIKTKSNEEKEVDVDVKNTDSSGAVLNGSDHTTPGHTVLILDETLQQIPWEVLPCLRGKTCSRIPSLALLLHVLTRHQASQTTEDPSDLHTSRNGEGSESSNADLGPPCRKMPLNSKEESSVVRTSNLLHTWYVLDPEGNLPATRATMSTFLQPYIDRYNWTGYIGEIPSEEAAKYVLDCNCHCLLSYGGLDCFSFKLKDHL